MACRDEDSILEKIYTYIGSKYFRTFIIKFHNGRDLSTYYPEITDQGGLNHDLSITLR